MTCAAESSVEPVGLDLHPPLFVASAASNMYAIGRFLSLAIVCRASDKEMRVDALLAYARNPQLIYEHSLLSGSDKNQKTVPETTLSRSGCARAGCPLALTNNYVAAVCHYASVLRAVARTPATFAS